MKTHNSAIQFILLLFLCTTISFAQSSDTSNSEAKVISSPDFVLSKAAIDAGIDGTLWIAVNIDSTGSVTSARIIAGPQWPCGTSPDEEIENVKKIAIETVKKSQFSPATKKGKPIDSEVGLNLYIGRVYKTLAEKREDDDRKKAGVPTISGGVLNGKARSLPKPAYPQSAVSATALGIVNISVLIDETGNVVSAGAKSGHPLLQSAARNAACKAKFAPTTLKGNPVKVSGTITYNFG